MCMHCMDPIHFGLVLLKLPAARLSRMDLVELVFVVLE